jgi:hypothetical protein
MDRETPSHMAQTPFPLSVNRMIKHASGALISSANCTLRGAAWRHGLDGGFAADLADGMRRYRRRVQRPSQQRFLRRPLPGMVKSFQKLNVTRRQDSRRNAVAVQQPVAGQGGQLRPWRENADQI